MELGQIQRKWVESLKAHPERQGKTFLADFKKDGSYKACVLGEYLLTYNREKGLPNLKNTTIVNTERLSSPTGGVTLLGDGICSELGLYNSFGLMKNSDGSTFFVIADDSMLCELTSLNDIGMPWPEIAKIIEKYPEKIFTKSL